MSNYLSNDLWIILQTVVLPEAVPPETPIIKGFDFGLDGFENVEEEGKELDKITFSKSFLMSMMFN